MKRRDFVKTLTLLGGYFYVPYLFSSNNSNVLRCQSVNELRSSTPTKEGELIQLESYHSGARRGGGLFISKFKGSNTTDDGGRVFVTNSQYIWLRVNENTSMVVPEWFGCIGDGKVDDSEAFNRMLNSLNEGAVIHLTNEAVYYNSLPEKSSRWIINKNGITIIGNGATLTRRSTRFKPRIPGIDGGNLATLKISADNFKIKGNLIISGGEDKDFLVDEKLQIISKESYTRGYVSSHALFLENSKNIYLSPGLICKDAVFPCYVLKCSNVVINGSYINAGQSFPVKGTDLQLGSGVKIDRTKSFYVNINTSDCAYCGCEIEPLCENGIVNVSSRRSYMHGCIIHQESKSIKVNINSYDTVKGAAIRISRGCKNIYGDVYSEGCNNAVIIISYGDQICEEIKLRIKAFDSKESDVLISNTQWWMNSLANSEIDIYPSGKSNKHFRNHVTVNANRVVHSKLNIFIPRYLKGDSMSQGGVAIKNSNTSSISVLDYKQ